MEDIVVNYELNSEERGLHFSPRATHCGVYMTERGEENETLYADYVAFTRQDMEDLLGLVALCIDRMDKLAKRDNA